MTLIQLPGFESVEIRHKLYSGAADALSLCSKLGT